MTIEEKATLLTGKGNWFFNGIPRLGIRDFVVGDGPHGLRAYDNLMEGKGYPKKRMPATMFPSASAMASTFNCELIRKVGETIGKECNHYNVDIILAPGVNGKRNPRAGRNFEYYSEDPVLAAEMAISFVNGVQSQGVGTSLKHFILNEQEHSRRFISSEVDIRTFRELYAYPFEQVVKKANPLTIMGSYNKINGVYACENKTILVDLLKKEWNYEGLVISDWGAVQNKRESVLSGMDIEMPQSEWKDAFIEDVKNGKYDPSLIDATVRRILKAYDWMMSNPFHGNITDLNENHLVAASVAEEAICLLKNDQDILPLSPKQKILVLGDLAFEPRIGGGGSSDLLPYNVENPLEEIKKFTEVTSFKGYVCTPEIMAAIPSHDVVLIFTGTTSKIESEGFDRKSMDLPEEQVSFLSLVTSYTEEVIIINSSGSAIAVHPFIQKVKGLIQTWFLGSACGKPLAKVLFGIVNPSGKLSETFPIKVENTSTNPYFPAIGTKAYYPEGLFTGYRFFDTHQIDPQFPFGFGLSYSKYEYSNGKISQKSLVNGETIEVAIDVKNSGGRDGFETVMLFIGYPKQEFVHPKKTLKQFKKISLSSGQTTRVVFQLSDDDFQVFSPGKKAFLVEKGDYMIHLGSNVRDIHYSEEIHFDSRDVCHLQKTLDFPAAVWLEADPEKSKLLELMNRYRQLHWWEREEPLERILNRWVKENDLSKKEYENMLHFLGI